MEPIQAFYETPKSNSRPDEHWLRDILAVLPLRETQSLLDIGCFDGSKTVMLRDALHVRDTAGVDFIRAKLADAEARGIRAQWADLNSGKPLEFPDQSFDLIVCSEVIEHVYSPDDLLDEIRRLLKPGGYAVITTPNLASWKNRLIFLLGWQPFTTEVSTRDRYGNPLMTRGQPSGHIRMFTLRALSEMLIAQGFKIVRANGVPLTSPQKNWVGAVSRFGDQLFTRFPALADRLFVCVVKS
jgi:methionine biosynthesis protein MetW